MKFITLFLFASVATAIRSRERLWKTISKSEIASYIVGGRDVMDGEAPWQVALQDSLPEYLCGGSIVTERWVLTSATCVPRLLQSGLYVRYNTLTLTGGQTITVQEIVKHPNFTSIYYQDNIALIKLQSSMTLDQTNAQYIELAQYHQELQENWKINITGWGRTTPDDIGDYSTNLKLLELKVLSNEKCYEFQQEIDNTKIFCAKPEEHNQCSAEGDRGGPGVHDKILYGVLVTSSQTCSNEPSYEFFIKVGQYYHWIQPIINLPLLR